MTRIAAAVTHPALLLCCILGLIWGVIVVHLTTEHQRAVQDAAQRSATLAQSLEENMRRSAMVLDTSLLNARASYLRDKPAFNVGTWMRDKPALMAIAVQMSIADASGTVVTASGQNGPPPVNIADREHFQVQQQARDDRLFISTPVIGRTTGRLSIQFTRRIVNPDGSFAGVAVASFDPTVISEFHNDDRLDGGFAMLVGADGIIRAAQPDTALIGRTFAGADALRRVAAAGSAPPAFGNDTEPAIVASREVAGYPLFAVAGFSRAVVFAMYDRERQIVLLAGTALSLTVLLVGTIMIQQRRKLTRFHQALLRTMDNISQGMLMIDQRRRMPVVNRRVAELLGLPEALARPGGEFAALTRWQEQHGNVVAGDAAIDPAIPFFECTNADGTVLEVRTQVLPDGCAVRTFTDVTERKRNERELAAARDAAQAGVRARTEFLAVMSHEIRTPINGIIGAAGLLQDMRLDPEQRDYLRVIRDSSDHLASLIRDILDFSRLDAGQLQLEQVSFDPGSLIHGTIAMLGAGARAKGLSLTATIGEDFPSRIIGDPFRLRQILANLVDNAIKFTNTGSVTVDARTGDADGETATLHIAVSDTGIGIDTENKQKLFSAFSQVDGSISRRFGGAGLGLVICRHLVALMGGAIAVDSIPGRGSTFRFTVRVRRMPAAEHDEPPAGAAPAPARARPLQVLLAEDNPTNRHVATRMLTRIGHAVDAVADGAQAISAAAGCDYDVILMDMMMPEVDGLTATRAIREGPPPGCHTVIIGLTANALPADREACIAAGMNDFVTKPVTLERLRAVLAQAAVTVPQRSPAAEASGNALDTAFLRQLCVEISPQGVTEMVRIFLDDAPGRMAAIRHGMANGTIQAVRREAHALAGAAGSVGLPRLSAAALALQLACEQAGPSAATIDAVAAALHASLPPLTDWAMAREALATSGA